MGFGLNSKPLDWQDVFNKKRVTGGSGKFSANFNDSESPPRSRVVQKPLKNSSEKNEWIRSYQENCHQLINFQYRSRISTAKEQNSLLLEICDLLFLEMQRMTDQSFPYNEKLIVSLVQRIVNEFTYIDVSTKDSLKSFINFIVTKNPSSLNNFQTFWGRGQQYLCFENNLEDI